MSWTTAALSLLVIAVGGTLFGFLVYLFLRARQRPTPPIVSPRTLAALGYGAPPPVRNWELRPSNRAERGVQRDAELAQDGEELPTYQAAGKDLPPPIDLPVLDSGNGPTVYPPRAAVVRGAPPPGYQLRASEWES